MPEPAEKRITSQDINISNGIANAWCPTLLDAIDLDACLSKVVQSPSFRRLANVRQLGAAHAVFARAKGYTRQEHALGSAWRMRKLGERLQEEQPELGLDSSKIQLMALAGLIHDIGHGPMSHTFEMFVSKRLKLENRFCHEDMGIKVIRTLAKKLSLDWSEDVISTLECMVSGQPSANHAPFMFELIANADHGLDVDVIDYLHRDSKYCAQQELDFQPIIDSIRVIDGHACFLLDFLPKMLDLYLGRRHLYQVVYFHPGVKAVELMLSEALASYLLATGCVEKVLADVERFAGYNGPPLDDRVMEQIATTDPTGLPREAAAQLRSAQALLRRVEQGDWYKLCAEAEVPMGTGAAQRLQAVSEEQLKAALATHMPRRSAHCCNDLCVVKFKVDCKAGAGNPLEKMRFYRRSAPSRSFMLSGAELAAELAGRGVALPQHFGHVYARVYHTAARTGGEPWRIIAHDVAHAFQCAMEQLVGMEARVQRANAATWQQLTVAPEHQGTGEEYKREDDDDDDEGEELVQCSQVPPHWYSEQQQAGQEEEESSLQQEEEEKYLVQQEEEAVEDTGIANAYVCCTFVPTTSTSARHDQEEQEYLLQHEEEEYALLQEEEERAMQHQRQQHKAIKYVVKEEKEPPLQQQEEGEEEEDDDEEEQDMQYVSGEEEHSGQCTQAEATDAYAERLGRKRAPSVWLWGTTGEDVEQQMDEDCEEQTQECSPWVCERQRARVNSTLLVPHKLRRGPGGVVAKQGKQDEDRLDDLCDQFDSQRCSLTQA